MKKIFASIWPHLLVLFTFLLVSVFYFMPQLEGKKMKSGDITQFKAMSHEIVQYKEKTGEVALWTNSMFGGMPAYQISVPQNKNLMNRVKDIQQLFISRPIGYFLGGMIGFYILMLVLGVSPLLGAFGAILFAFSTNNLVLFEAGHMSKLSSIFSIPLYLAGMILTFRKKYFIGGLIFTVGLAINILHNHLQMTYLLAILSGMLLIFYFFKYLKEKELKHFGTVVSIFIIGAILALATSSSKIWTTYEYAKDTMRGNPILKSNHSTPASSSETKGLEWTYAMQWSNGWEDLLSSFIAGAVGGGSAEPVSKSSAFAKKYKQLAGGRLPSDLRAPLYWGKLPGTSGPIYFGAVAFFLFLFGALTVRGKMKWWLVSGVILTLLFSLGSNFEVFNRLFFDYFPYFNKFRAPNSILSITVFLIPLLGILGIRELRTVKDKKSIYRKLYISAGILGGLALLLALLGGVLFDFSSPDDSRYQQMDLLNAIVADRKSLLVSDSLKSFGYIAVSAFFIWLYLKNKLKYNFMIGGIVLVAMIDLVSVDLRYVDHNDFLSKSRSQNDFKLREVDRRILQDPDLYYRVLDYSINTFNSSMSSYYHKTIGGYHAAKLQRYQDLIDKYISIGNMNVLNMLNTKYIIQGKPGEEELSQNKYACGNAWFVSYLYKASDANEEIEKLATLDPHTAAIYHQEFDDYMGSYSPEGYGTIRLSSYSPNKLTYDVRSGGDEFVVFSEIWYGPDKGWKAYLDGVETEFIRVNYALRGMKVPLGNHQIIFEFKPKSYYIGETISLASSGLLVLLLLFAIGREGFRFYKKEKQAVS